jgi:hypothetical protein
MELVIGVLESAVEAGKKEHVQELVSIYTAMIKQANSLIIYNPSEYI